MALKRQNLLQLQKVKASAETTGASLDKTIWLVSHQLANMLYLHVSTCRWKCQYNKAALIILQLKIFPVVYRIHGIFIFLTLCALSESWAQLFKANDVVS